MNVKKFPNEAPRKKFKCPRCKNTSFEFYLSHSKPEKVIVIACNGKFCNWVEHVDGDDLEWEVE